LLCAINYCHKMHIVHRDMKPENILIESEVKGFINIKLIDFGTAKIFINDVSESKIIGSSYYIAPEVLQKDYNEKCDLWSCGIILYILISGEPPFNGDNDMDIMKNIKKGNYSMNHRLIKNMSAEGQDLLKRLLDGNKNTRISAEEALNHHWFEKLKVKDMFVTISREKLNTTIQNLQKFKYNYKLQEAALSFIVHNSLHLEEVKNMYKTFHSIDTNNDGKISKEEMTVLLQNFFGLDDVRDEVDKIFKNIDSDNNGYIEYEEFVRASIDKGKLLTDSILRYTFDYFDKDKSGEITVDELKQVFCMDQNNNISDDLINEMVNQVDLDGNKVITYEEFKDMLRKIII